MAGLGKQDRGHVGERLVLIRARRGTGGFLIRSCEGLQSLQSRAPVTEVQPVQSLQSLQSRAAFQPSAPRLSDKAQTVQALRPEIDVMVLYTQAFFASGGLDATLYDRGWELIHASHA